eukprot:TRINITY_DN5886_c0_g1_i1.p1 TRINITY_DN5886_c0_g1~~TRINITY_DN5886_c0_g1_i1.p1  ORF type:complete len:1020 (-),score=286.89 TRINITY_DN5886_c0_g1_i1:4-3063(-)
MPSVTTEALASLQSNANNIRNICILAHVDHGKTTLSDTLISTNGIISSNLAGKIRYLDNRPDEILRQITMKSSCISLLHKNKKATDSNDFLVHLIDSPGHVDFSSEVSTAVRAADGAVVVVDVIEGVCIQTVAVLRQAWAEKLGACLVLNKVDKLITELHLTPVEAYKRIKQVLDHVNMVTSSLVSEDVFKKMENEQTSEGGSLSEEESVLDWETLSKKEEVAFFSPEQNNVVFGSAFHGWGFSTGQFVDLYSKKLGMKKEILQKTLWGEFYFNAKTKRIHTKNYNDRMVPMFVQFVLNNIWEVYNAANTDRPKLEKIISTLQLKVPARDLNQADPNDVAQAVLNRWLPINEAVLQMVIDTLPSPKAAQPIRIPKIWQPPVGTTDEMIQQLQHLKNNMLECDASDSAELVVFVSKIFSVPPESFQNVIVQPGQKMEGQAQTVRPTEEKFIAFARVFSGTLRKGRKVHILGPRYNPAEPTKHHYEAEINELYLLMGRGVEAVEEIPAGNICGIGGLEEFIIKSATISSTPLCSTFNILTNMSSPIVRVAIEPEIPSQMPKLIEGLKLLNQADPSVEVLVQETGEHVLVASGELHLERCLTDLRESFAKIAIRVSPPLVAFRETVTADPNLRYSNAAMYKDGVPTSNKLGSIKVKALPLPDNIAQFLQSSSAIIRRIFVEESVDLKQSKDAIEFRMQLIKEFTDAGEKWLALLNSVWAFGHRRTGPNLLVNQIPDYSNSGEWSPITKKMEISYEPNLRRKGERSKKQEHHKSTKSEHREDSDSFDGEDKKEEEVKLVTSEEKIRMLKELDSSIINGFQLATAAGPMCEEPMMGVCFVVEDIILREAGPEKSDTWGPFSGQIMSTMKEACRQAFLSKSQRIMEPIYTCNIQVTAEMMGKAYNVLGRRRAKITNEEVKDNGNFFIESLLPVAESFGLSKELLTQTSGAASSQLEFKGWQVLDQDPYFVSTTEEELEDIGENLGGIAPNTARLYIDSVRRRKGLPVEEKLVKFAEKQRTLSKKK